MLMPSPAVVRPSQGITGDFLTALDPVRLARAAGMEPDPWQRDVLRSGSSRLLLNCSRQSGKSTVTSIASVHTALYEPGALILLLSPSLRQSTELFRKCLSVYRKSGRPVPATAENALSLELANGARIVSLPGHEETVRSFSGVRLIVIDEASRVPNDLYVSVRPMLAVSGGRLIALSSPFGTRGWFYEAWRGPERWQRFEVPATLCPRIMPEFLEEERRALGSFWFEQEYMCRFLDAQSAAFATADIEAAFDGEVETWSL